MHQELQLLCEGIEALYQSCLASALDEKTEARAVMDLKGERNVGLGCCTIQVGRAKH